MWGGGTKHGPDVEWMEMKGREWKVESRREWTRTTSSELE